MIVRDFRRNRTVTVVLVLLKMLAVVMAPASTGTLGRLVGASSSPMARADTPGVAQLHLGPYDENGIHESGGSVTVTAGGG